MKWLIVGTGRVGGYFGKRLLEGGSGVTFLVRENRQKKLQETGMVTIIRQTKENTEMMRSAGATLAEDIIVT